MRSPGSCICANNIKLRLPKAIFENINQLWMLIDGLMKVRVLKATFNKMEKTRVTFSYRTQFTDILTNSSWRKDLV